MSATDVIAQLAVNLRLDSSQFARGSNLASSRAKKLESQFGGFSKTIGVATNAIGAFGGAFTGGLLAGGIAEVGSKLVELGEKALDNVASLHAVSQQLGVSVEDLQKFRYAASQTGISSDQMDLGLRRLSKAIGQAANGTGPAVKTFDRLGISVRDSNGHIKTAGSLMPELAGALAKLPDPAARAAAEVAIFGRSGQDLAPLLNRGAEGVQSLTSEAQKLGIVLSSDQVEKAHNLEIRLKALKEIIEAKTEAGIIKAITGIEGIAEHVGQQIDTLDQKLKGLQDSADKFDKAHGIPTKSEFLGDFANAPVEAFDKSLQEVQKHVAELDKQLGIPSPTQFIDSILADFQKDTAERAKFRSQVVADLAAIAAKTESAAKQAWASFDHWWRETQNSTHRMVQDVSTWLGAKLHAAVAGAKSAAQQVGDWFHEMHDRVTGHSDVPDMVDEIAAEMRRLDTVMVDKARETTQSTAAAFQQLKNDLAGLLGSLYPEAAQNNRTLADLKTLNDAQKAGLLTANAWADAVQRLLSSGGGVSEEIQHAGDVADQLQGSGDLAALVKTMPQLKAATADLAADARSRAGEIAQAFGGVADAITDVITGTKSLKDAFGQTAKEILHEIIQMTVKMLIFRAVSAVLGNFGGGVTPGGSSVADSAIYDFGGGLATGGPAVPGKTYVVGENGPEFLSMGSSRGFVTPANDAGPGGITVNQTIAPNFAGNAATRDDLVRMGVITKNAAIQAIREERRRSA